jgi:hypothetical protein
MPFLEEDKHCPLKSFKSSFRNDIKQLKDLIWKKSQRELGLKLPFFSPTTSLIYLLSKEPR